MSFDLLDLYSRASAWTNEKVAKGAADLDVDTPCEAWDLRTLLDHMLETQRYFGWDVARASGQDATMPDGLPDAAYDLIHGRFTDDERKGVFGPEIALGPDPSPQERLLAYTGRQPN